jgi:hypothetical protein
MKRLNNGGFTISVNTNPSTNNQPSQMNKSDDQAGRNGGMRMGGGRGFDTDAMKNFDDDTRSSGIHYDYKSETNLSVVSSEDHRKIASQYSNNSSQCGF